MKGAVNNRSIFLLNIRDLLEIYAPNNDVPLHIWQIIFAYSNHVRIGKRSLSWLFIK